MFATYQSNLVYEIRKADGQTVFAMAFFEGESLDKRIEQGRLKILKALDIAFLEEIPCLSTYSLASR